MARLRRASSITPPSKSPPFFRPDAFLRFIVCFWCYLFADQLNKRDIRAGRLLALAEVVKLVERAMVSLESAALSCFGNDRCWSGGRGDGGGGGSDGSVAAIVMVVSVVR